MAKPLLEPLIASFSPSERRRVREWLLCPLHNRREEVTKLYEQLLAQLPFVAPAAAPDSEEPTAIPKNFSTEERLQRSYLLRALEDYLSFEVKRQERKHPIDLCLLTAYRNRGLDRHLENRINRQRAAVTRRPQYGYSDYYAEYQLEEFSLHQTLSHSRKLAKDYHQGEKRLLRAQFAAYFRQASLSLASQPFTSEPPGLPLLDVYLTTFRQTPSLSNAPGVSLYYYLCCDYLPGEAASRLPFSALVNLFRIHHRSFSEVEQGTLLKLLLNRSVHRINQDASEENLRQALGLYKLGISADLLVHRQQISTFTFSNVLAIAIRLKELRFAEDFLTAHSTFLPAATAASILSFNRARLAYVNQDYAAALLFLQQGDFKDSVHLMNARFLTIRIYYETGETGVLEHYLHATRILLGRKRSNYHQQVYRNNLKMVGKLVSLNRSQQSEITRIRKEVEDLTPLSEKSWLLIQLDNLKSQ